MRGHLPWSKACLAALTAKSTSSLFPSDIFAITSPFLGSIVSNVFPEWIKQQILELYQSVTCNNNTKFSLMKCLIGGIWSFVNEIFQLKTIFQDADADANSKKKKSSIHDQIKHLCEIQPSANLTVLLLIFIKYINNIVFHGDIPLVWHNIFNYDRYNSHSSYMSSTHFNLII